MKVVNSLKPVKQSGGGIFSGAWDGHVHTALFTVNYQQGLPVFKKWIGQEEW